MAPEPTADAVGRALRLIREEQGLTLAEVGERADVDRQYLEGLEDGRRNPPWSHVAAIAAALGVEVSEVARRAEALSDGGPPPPAER